MCCGREAFAQSPALDAAELEIEILTDENSQLHKTISPLHKTILLLEHELEEKERELELANQDPLPVACDWHDDAHRVEYNQILHHIELERLFAQLEGTLFRSGDRHGWCSLQNKMRGLFQAQQIKILVGRPMSSKWIHITCVNCGKCVFVNYTSAGCTAEVTPETLEQRRQLFEFFQCPDPTKVGNL